MRFAAFLIALLLPVTALAGPSPLDGLFASLKKCASPEEAKPIEAQILARFRQSNSPSVDLLMARADTAFATGDKDTASRLIVAVTDIAPDFAEGWHVRANLQADAKDDEGAMLSLQKTVKLNPRQFEAMTELAEMLEEYGDKPGALKLLRAVGDLDPQYEGLKRRLTGLSRDVEGQGI